MLLIIAHYLSKYISALRIFEYVSFRSLMSCLTALLISIFWGSTFIQYLTKINIEQSIRNDGPQTHLVKSGTPTMGGILILFSIAVSTLLFTDLTNPYIWLLLFVLLSNGVLGFIDDYKKILYKNS